MPPQADVISNEKSISQETLEDLQMALDENACRWRMAVEFVSGSMIKAISNEEQARQAIKVMHRGRPRKRGEAPGSSQAGGRPFCVRCKDEFRIADNPDDRRSRWEMGVLKKLKFAPRRIRDGFKDWAAGDLHGEPWLCGNCYFDISDGAPLREL